MADLKEHGSLAHQLIQEAKGLSGDVADHLDAAENHLSRLEDISTGLFKACQCVLGYLTQGMDGDFDGEVNPVHVLREALEKAGA